MVAAPGRGRPGTGGRGRLAGVLTAVLALGAGVAAAERKPAEVGPSQAWLDLVSRYAGAEREAAVDVLASWTADDVARLRTALEGWRRAAASCPLSAAETRPLRVECQAAARYRAFPLRQAVLLHVERGWADQAALPTDRESPHAPLARAIVELDVLPRGGDAAPFARAFYLYMALRAHGEMLLDSAAAWARAGLVKLPDDPQLLLALGTVEESVGSMGLAAAPGPTPPGTANTGSFRARIDVLNARAARLQQAATALARAREAAPELHEAALRIGRVRWRQGDPERAREALEAVLERTYEKDLLYLAHLFLGRLHEDAARRGEAETEYLAAAALVPDSQAARLALSHLRLAGGDAAGARRAFDEAVAPAGRRHRRDAFWTYPWGRSDDAASLLIELRRMAAP